MPFSPKLVRIARRLFIGLAVFVTLISLAVVIENWRGNNAWKNYYAKHAARGEILDALPAPSTLPAGENFLKTPVIDRWLFTSGSEKKLRDFLSEIHAPYQQAAYQVTSLFRFPYGEYFDHEKFVNLVNKARSLSKLPLFTSQATPPAQTLELIASMDPVLTELRYAAKERPESQVVRPTSIDPGHPFNYTIPNFTFPREIGIALALHASASLALAKPNIAFQDTMAGLKFARGVAGAPDTVLVETMIGAVLAKLPLQPIWEAQQRRAWTDGQLSALQQELGKPNYFDSLKRSFRTERAGFICGIQNEKAMWGKGAWLVPQGWFQQNKISFCEAAIPRENLLALLATPAFSAAYNKTEQYPKHFGTPFSPYSYWASWALPAWKKITGNVAYIQTLLTLAQTACALERHWLANGNYPEHLAELVPTYLDKVPLDLIDGQPLRYRRTDDGKFVLYSIGLDGKDDGGKPVDPKQTDAPGDWIWPQPAAANP